MYPKKGRWWVSLVLSLHFAAAKATPAVGNGASQTPSFFYQDHNLTTQLPSYRGWHPVDTSAAGAAALPYGARQSPLPIVGPQHVPPTSSPPPTSHGPYEFSFFSEQELPLTAAVGNSHVSGRRNSQINPRIAEATSGGRRNGRDSDTRSSFTNSSIISRRDSTPHSSLRTSSHDNDSIFSALDDSSVFSDNAGVLGDSGGGFVSSPLTSPDIFRFPSALPDDSVFQQLPSFHTMPDASFWKYSAWRRVNARPNEVILLTDVDDTLWSSGGWRVADYTIGGVDKEYARGDAYPGLTALYFVLAAGRHVTAAADPPTQPVNFLLPYCPHPGFRSPLLELCPAIFPPHPRAASSSFPFTDISPSSPGNLSSGGASPAGELDVASIEGLFISTPLAGRVTSQHSPAAAAASPFSQRTVTSQSSPPTFCAASSFSPATGLRRPNPAQCRAPLVLPPAVGLLTARLSTTFFKGWTRSPTFYHDIDWQLEHGARMIYGPNIFAGAWTLGFENNVELMRDAIGGQHSRGRAKVQGFRSALRAGLRPAAQVAATFAAARLQLAAEETAAGTAGGGRQHALPNTASSTAVWSGSGPTSRQRGGARRNKFSSSEGYKFARHSVAGLAYTHGVQRTATAGGVVTRGEQSPKRIAPDLGSLAALESSQPAGMSVGLKDGSASLGNSGGSSPGRDNEEAVPIAEFEQAIHFSKPTVSNRAVPVLFGDTGEKDLEVAASVAALFPDRLAAVFSHFVFADRDAEKLKGCMRAETAVPTGSVPFTFNFNGVRIRAFQFTFDVGLRIGQGAGYLPRSVAELDDGQAYAVGQRVALYLREAIAIYSRNYLAEVSKLEATLQTTATAAARDGEKRIEQPVQAHPLLFVKFSRLIMSGPSQGPAQSPQRSGFSGLLSRVRGHLKRKVSELTNSAPEEEPSQGVDVVPLHPIKKTDDPRHWDHGVPIIPYRTTISAATGALLVHMISVQDLVNIVIASVRDLRSLGPPTSCSNVDPVEDHLFDVLVVMNLLGGRIRGDTVQHYETYKDAVAALRTFYDVSRFCKTLLIVDFKADSPPPSKEEPSGRWFSDVEAVFGGVGVNVPWGQLQQSPTFEACFTAFALTTEPSAAEASSEGDADAQRQRNVPRTSRRLRGSVESAADYLERYAPGVLVLARVACAQLPQLLHWRSAGGGELEFMSAEWLVALTQATALSKRTSVNHALRKDGSSTLRKSLRGEGSSKKSRWQAGDERARRLSEATDIRWPFVAATGSAAPKHDVKRDDLSALSPQSSEKLPSDVRSDMPPARPGTAATYLESSATSADTGRVDLQTSSRDTTQQMEAMRGNRQEDLRAPLPVADSSSAYGHTTIDAVGGSNLSRGLLTPSTFPSALVFNETALQIPAVETNSATNASLVDLLDMSEPGGPGASAFAGNYLPNVDDLGHVAAPQQANRRPKSSDGDLPGGVRRPNGPTPVTFFTKDCDAAYGAPGRCRTPSSNETLSASGNRGGSSAADSSVACPALNLHHLLRVMRLICGAQRHRLGENAPCAVLSRILYDEKMLSTFNGIQSWIKSGSAHPLYLENIGVTLDPSGPKGGARI